MDSLPDVLHQVLSATPLRVVDQVVLPERTAEFAEIPSELHPSVIKGLRRQFARGIYSHQAKGIAISLGGKDLCVATSTASGKSLVFLSVAGHVLATESRARILALYPAKALIQDQLGKWNESLSELGFSVGYIDGAVPVPERHRILDRNRAVLMTPDVAHAWLLNKAGDASVGAFLSDLKLLILDEAHVYDGVFGTNMAYLVRRILALSPSPRIISSTATIGSPDKFIELLTGRSPEIIADSGDGSFSPQKHVMLLRPEQGVSFEATALLVRNLARGNAGKFLAFADSRKTVEQLVAVAERSDDADDELLDDLLENDQTKSPALSTIVGNLIQPYRAGYEESDRAEIQRALSNGSLKGVVSTSALELGLDIGDVDIVVLLGTPPSVKSFRQRLGRCGRRRPGVCLIVDDRERIVDLGEYLRKRPEPAWLYLDNRYIQYAHALCAAAEHASVGSSRHHLAPFDSLPGRYRELLRNEINPTEAVADDLYPLKQRAQAGPHFEFPLRSAIEKSFSIRERGGPAAASLGTVTYSQVLREAYPGAVYLYRARPYRIHQVSYRSGEIHASRFRRWTTRPILKNMVFPRIPAGIFSARKSGDGFVAECELQVNERLIGFTERRGSATESFAYGPLSPFAQRPMTRYVDTTGVCWHFPDAIVLTEAVAQAILTAFSTLCGVSERDLGFGTFRARSSDLWPEDAQGMAIYDAVNGSLRLTQRLFAEFEEVVQAALEFAEEDKANGEAAVPGLLALRGLADSMGEYTTCGGGGSPGSQREADDWVVVIAAGQKAMYVEDTSTEEIEVLGFRYTPQGLMYEVGSGSLKARILHAAHVKPVYGETELLEANLVTGETRPLGESGAATQEPQPGIENRAQ